MKVGYRIRPRSEAKGKKSQGTLREVEQNGRDDEKATTPVLMVHTRSPSSWEVIAGRQRRQSSLGSRAKAHSEKKSNQNKTGINQ